MFVPTLFLNCDFVRLCARIRVAMLGVSPRRSAHMERCKTLNVGTAAGAGEFCHGATVARRHAKMGCPNPIGRRSRTGSAGGKWHGQRQGTKALFGNIKSLNLHRILGRKKFEYDPDTLCLAGFG
jgi:hypothetical protein